MAMTAQGRTSSVDNRLGYNNNTMRARAESKASVFSRLGKVSPPAKKTCIYWAKGRCNKVNCPYLHSEQPAQKTSKFLAPKKQHSPTKTKTKQSLDTRTKQLLAPQVKQMVADHLKPYNNGNTTKQNLTWNGKLKNSPPSQNQESDSRTVASRSEDNEIHAECSKSDPVELIKEATEETEKPESDSRTVASRSEDNEIHAECSKSDSVELIKEETEETEKPESDTRTVASRSEDNELHAKCSESDPLELIKEAIEKTRVGKCESFETSSQVPGLTKLAELKGHSKAIAGIALPSSSTKLYTGCKDKSVRVWDCSTGQCTSTELLNDEVVCMITRGPWLFAGTFNNIKAWNLDHRVECSLNVTGGRVNCMEFDNDVLFAGMEDGSILVWKRNPDTSEFELVAKTKSHTGPVLALVMGSGHGKLYSASSDSSIKVWNQYMQCVQTLHGHTREVTSLLCRDKHILSSSLDKTLKVWSQTESGDIEMVHELKEDHGFVSVGGIILRPDGQHMLPCSLDDNSVRLYDLSFVEKGRISSKEQAPAIHVGVDGLFFIGDGAGNVSVWRLA